MATMKFGWHIGPTGTGVPKEHYQQLKVAAVPFVAKGADAFPFDAQQNAGERDVAVFRRSVGHDGTLPPSGNPDIPDYNKSPHDAAVEHYDWHRDHMPIEMNPTITWLEIINEVDKDRSEWLAEFALSAAALALSDGIKLAMFGWSTGEPEYGHWEGPKMLEFLRLCAQHPSQLAVALHEYSLTTDTLWQDSPYLVGRFQFLHDVCDEYGIGYPTIIITEFGWTYDNVAANINQGIDELVEVGALYAEYPNVKGAAIWYLGGGFGDIAQKAAPMIPLLQDKLLTVTYPDVDHPPPPPPDKTLDQKIWDFSVQHQIDHGVMLNADAALQKLIRAAGMSIVTNEGSDSIETEGLVIQAAETYDNSKERRVYIYDPSSGAARWITDPYSTPPPPPPPTDYSGPSVNFVAMVDNPASDWRWPQAKAVFDVTGLTPKFHTQGNNHQWYDQYKSPIFNMVRILVDPNFSGDLLAETEGNVAQFYALGARDFEVLNEPNIEGMGVRWNDGVEFGVKFREYCKELKARFPGIRLWFPGLSPGFGAQYTFIDEAISVGAFDHIVGICEHVYSGIADNVTAARQQMFTEVMEFRSRYAMTRPLFISEMSVNRPAPASYKAQVYKDLFVQLAAVPGIQGCTSFTSDWEPSGDESAEGWLKHGIHTAYASLIN